MQIPEDILIYIKKYIEDGYKIFSKKITSIDIDQYNEDAIDNFSIYPKIYDYLKISPCSGDILFGLYKSNIDYSENCIIILRDKIFYKI